MSLTEEEVRKMLKKATRSRGDKGRVARTFFGMSEGVFRNQLSGEEPLGTHLLSKLGLEPVRDQKNRTIHLEVKKE